MCLSSEAAVIASVLAQPGGLDLAVDALDVGDFENPTNRVVFKAISELHTLKLPVDIPAVKDWLVRNGHVGVVDPEAMQRALSMTPYVSNVAEHIRLVKQHSRLRTFINTARRLSIEAYDAGDDIEGFLGRAEADVYHTIADGGSVKVIHHIKDTVREFFQNMSEELQAREQGRLVRASTGIKSLDRLIGGLYNGQLVVVAARPSMGKTALLLNMATHVATTNATPRIGSHVVTMESDRLNVTARIISADARYAVERLVQSNVGKDDWGTITDACARCAAMPVTIDDRSGLTLAQIRSSVRRAQAELRKVEQDGTVTQQLGAVFVDYLQLCKHAIRGGSREQEISAVAYGLLDIAKEFRVPVVALSQLNRDCEKRDDKRPKMSDIRESGAIEQAANVILALYREDYYKPNTEDAGLVEIAVLKSKDSKTGTIKVRFSKASTRFDNLSEDERSPEPDREYPEHWQEGA